MEKKYRRNEIHLTARECCQVTDKVYNQNFKYTNYTRVENQDKRASILKPLVRKQDLVG